MTWPSRQDVDAVLLSVGANDVSFSSIIEFCARFTDCPHRHFDPRRPLQEAPAPAPTLDVAIAGALRGLAARYDRLDGEISARIARGGSSSLSTSIRPSAPAERSAPSIWAPARSTPARRSGRTPTWSAG